MPDQNTEVIVARLAILSDDIGEVRSVMKELAQSVAKLALIEERQTQANEALSRAFKSIDKIDMKLSAIESRVATIERDIPLHKQSSTWVFSALWAAAGAAVLMIVKKVGVI
ncbi:hypothetical protein [Thauera humireducens]|uniref:Uncharacterized protein n=1 Tax=Thauera humireducens TaxID=1134435 RepID=A0A127K384_9RHOO|nr:hypothetical protein [Thauera humireducens]AMO36415.1 hypothetical protein AC731_005375 [Thauera humireducens]